MTTMTDDLREQLVSYVRHQVAKGPAGMRQAIQKGYDEILGQLEGISDEQSKFKSTPADWSVLEVLRHVEESTRATARSCAQLARGEQAAAIGAVGIVTKEPAVSLAQARGELAAAHAELLAFVDSVSSETNVTLTRAHPSFGSFNCLEWAVFERVHDGDHANQIEQIKSAPGYPSSP